MNIRLALSLATASLWYRRRLLALACLSLTLSVTLLLGIQYLRTDIKQSFTSTISGTDLIVGARSGPLNLLLYTVFHIGDATNNIRWSTYQSLRSDPRIDWLIPISLGDSYRGYRVVGTDRAFLEHFRYGDDQALQLVQGQWFADVFDVVLGATVAREMGHSVGDQLVLAHGGGRTSFAMHDDTPFQVSGILAATGTPVDRAVYISLDGMEAMHVGWESGVAIPGRTLTPESARGRTFTPDAITAVYLGLKNPVMTFRVQRSLNEFSAEPLSAILPGVALSELWRLMGQFENALLAITGFVVITSLAGLAAILLTLQHQRAHEIAVLRATGASTALVAWLQVIECVALALIACLLAVILGALMLTTLAPWLQSAYGIQIGLRAPTRVEWLLLASVPGAALLAGLMPAWSAWRQARRQGFSAGTDQ